MGRRAAVLKMSAWPDLELDVMTEIHLDPKNVRLETASAQVEADIIEDLFVNEDALGLVQGIATIGYLSHEVPIVVRRSGKYIVVEGNRRVAALKAIQNPMIVPEFQARVASLTRTMPDKSQLAKIMVKLAPNQAQADQLIAALHTSNPRRAWSPARQAAFFQAQIDAGRTYKQLLTRYPTVDVRRFVFRGYMVNLFKGVPYSDPALRDFLRTKTWQRGLSALARVFESKDFVAITGLRLDEDGVLKQSVSNETLAEMATLIVTGMMEGNLNTRSLNTTKSARFLQLMTELRRIADAENAQQKDNGSAGTGRDGTDSSSSGDSKAETDNGPEGSEGGASGGGKGDGADGRSKGSTRRTRSSKAAPRWIDVGHLKVPDSYPVAVGIHLGELSITDIQRLPNSTFLMLRAILEKSIKSYADAKDEDIKDTARSRGGYVQLSHALEWLLGYVRANGPLALVQPIQRVASGKLVTYTASKDSLDAINHNHHFCVDADEVLNMWNSIDPLMRELMKP
jgi:hypothetical protein